MNTKLVIFLDIDGVLLPVSPFSFGGGDLDDSLVAKLRQVVEQACGGNSDNLTIVLSSTWRNDESKKVRLNEAFARVGGLPKVVLGVPNGVPHQPTSVTYLPKNLDEQRLIRDRVDEIYEWLRLHEATYPHAARGGRWFALDDLDLGIDSRMHQHFIKTDTEEGISNDDVRKAVALVKTFAPFVDQEPPVVAAAVAEKPPQALPGYQEDQHGASQYPPPLPPPPATSYTDLTNREGPFIGMVKRYNPTRGFGFVTNEATGEDVFIHQSCILQDGFRAVNVGEKVQFYTAFHGGKKQCIDVAQDKPYVPSPPHPFQYYQRQFHGHQPASLQQQGFAVEAMMGVPSDVVPQPQQRHPSSSYIVPGHQGSMNVQAAPPAYRQSVLLPGGGRGRGGGGFGRGRMDVFQLPLLPDGLGYRAANGVVFYPHSVPGAQ